MVMVTCRNASHARPAEPIFKIFHAQPPAEQFVDYADESDTKLSLLLICLESTSLSQFKRDMPLTAKYVSEEMGMFVFNSEFIVLITSTL